MTELTSSNAELTKQDDILQEIKSFYRNLYKSYDDTLENVDISSLD